MAKLTKAQQKRLVRDAQRKLQKLYVGPMFDKGPSIVSTADIMAIDKLCKKFLQRIG